MMEFWILNPIGKWFMPRLVHNLRKWDFLAAQRPDYFLANSKNTKNRIKKYYNREAEVVYPWIDTEKFIFSSEKKDFYLYVWRCIPYKKFDLIVDAFNKNWKKIVIITNTDNKLFRKLKSISKENISWKLNISFEEIKKYYSEAKAFLFPPEEDFWLVPIEAMASWTPVIAFWKWWALETVVDSETWVFFGEQTVESLNKAIERFEKLSFDYDKIKKHSEKFDKKYFKQNILEFIEKNMKKD